MHIRSDYLYTGGFTLLALAVGSILVMLISAPLRFYVSALEFAPLVWVRRPSYGLYLWHWPIFYMLRSKHPTSPLGVMLPLQIGTTFLAAALSFYLIEQPFLKLKLRFSSGANRSSRVESFSPQTATAE